MLAVVVLVPIAIMVLACLLERFEARAVPARRTARTPRSDLRAPAALPAAPLRLVPGAVDEPVGPALPDLDAPTARLRPAS